MSALPAHAVPCGANGQVECPRGCAEGLTSDANGICRPCGRLGQPSCEGSCEKNLTTSRGVCMPCGGCGQMPCLRKPVCQTNLVSTVEGVNRVCRPAPGSNVECSAFGQTVVGKGSPPQPPPKPPACECSSTSNDPACGLGIGAVCDLDGPRLCQPGLGCTWDATGQGPRRCRAPDYVRRRGGTARRRLMIVGLEPKPRR